MFLPMGGLRLRSFYLKDLLAGTTGMPTTDSLLIELESH
jgi:hypothetical protein